MVYRFKGFQEPFLETKNDVLNVYMNDIETTSFLTPKNSTQSSVLKLISHRHTTLLLPKSSLSKFPQPFKETEALEGLERIKALYNVYRKIKKPKKLSFKRFKKEDIDR